MSTTLFLPCLFISLLLFSGGAADTGTVSPSPPTNARFLNRARKAEIARQFLQAHNQARESVGMPALNWDSALARFAAQWTDHRRLDCKVTHSGGPYGENMFWFLRGKNWTPDRVVAKWAEERLNYDPKTNTCAAGEMCGHYTQIIWRTTTSVGCARVKCENGAGHLVVCEYSPRGNYEGESPFDGAPTNESGNGNVSGSGNP